MSLIAETLTIDCVDWPGQVGTTRDEEVERAVGLGASVVDDRREPSGAGWVVLADPEGNEFCVERSHAEKAAARAANP